MKNTLLPTLGLAIGLMLRAMAPAAAAIPAGTLSAAPAGTLSAAAAADSIDGERLLRHIRILASDRYEGRAPGGAGERLTLDYLQRQFMRMGLAPGKPDGGYLQTVPLLEVRTLPALSYSTGARSSTLNFPGDFLAWSQRAANMVTLTASDMLFVGYGVNAPSYGWNDYKDTDVRGKTLLMLAGAPSAAGAGAGGHPLAYYARPAQKIALAQQLGAAAVLIVHEAADGAASYETLRRQNTREKLSLRGMDSSPALAGWLRPERAQDMLRAVGYDLASLKKAAQSRAFQPLVLGIEASADSENSWRQFDSYNVVAKIEGSDPLLKDQAVVYTANWDQAGVDPTLPGSRTQQIYHGARQNAAGVAALLEVARAYRSLRVAPKRSILFVLTTGGAGHALLGARHYTSHPLFPLAKTVLSIHVDGLQLDGHGKAVELAGFGLSSADQVVQGLAKRQGRSVRAAPQREAGGVGGLYDGDQFAFASAGVPVVALAGASVKAQGGGTDVVQASWDLSGAEQDAALLFQIGYAAAQGRVAPAWRPGAPFKAARPASPAASQ